MPYAAKKLLRQMMILLVVIGMMGSSLPGFAFQDEDDERFADLAAMPLPPHDLVESGFQFAAGGYLTLRDARYLIELDRDVESGAVADALDAAGWQQGFTQTLVLLEDRSIRTSTPLAEGETTIHELADGEGAELIAALMSGALPEDAEPLDPAVAEATTYRTVTSQDDRLVTIVRVDRLVIEVISADAIGTPDETGHAEIVEATLGRVRSVIDTDAYGLSERIVPLADSRLIPLAIAPESPLVHTYYRLIDGTVVAVAGELDAPEADDLAPGVEEIVVSRQTAELASQSWLTAGVIVIDFANDMTAEAFAESGVIHDPLDIFAVDEASDSAQPMTEGLWIDSLSGESRVGGRYSGYHLTVQDDSSVAQMTIRVMGNVRLDQQAVEGWALAQRDCLADGECDPVMLTDLQAAPDPSTPVASGPEDGVYQSPVAAWSLAFDADTWRVEDAFAEGGYDYLYLRSERMDATFETIVDQHGDPEQCVLDELDRLRELEESAVITLGSDDPDEPPGGLEAGRGWVIYTVEPLAEARADDDYTLRIDCYTVFERSTSLVVQVRVPRDMWVDVSAQGDEI
ncbi:MAG: hypothetical protein M3451_05180, partial [Chloroflexota bacterium]|nr:hypothetical protein [Chloroflexota bacterium]